MIGLKLAIHVVSHGHQDSANTKYLMTQ